MSLCAKSGWRGALLLHALYATGEAETRQAETKGQEAGRPTLGEAGAFPRLDLTLPPSPHPIITSPDSTRHRFTTHRNALLYPALDLFALPSIPAAP